MITNFNEFKESIDESTQEDIDLNERQLMKDISDDVIINIWKNANKKNLSHKEIMGSMSQISGVSETELEKFLDKHKELIEESETPTLSDESLLEFLITNSNKSEFQTIYTSSLEKHNAASPFELNEEERKELYETLSEVE